MEKAIPWNKIKAEYLQGAVPRELASKYNIDAKTIGNKASANNWVVKKKEIQIKIENDIREKIKEASALAIMRLREILESNDASNSDVVAATRAILDVSGLKSQKLETTITEVPIIKDDIPE